MTSGDTSSAAPWPVRRDLLALALLALAVRLTFLWAGLASQNLSALAMVAPDSSVYAQLTEHVRTGLPVEERLLLVATPGYPALLAGLASVFGDFLWPAVMLNILLGAMAPVAVYLIAAALIQQRTVAVLSGLWVTLSFTGLSMSTSLLTDQPFYTLHAFGLLFFLWGLRTGRTRWFVAAGVVSTVATAIRPLGQLWVWVYPMLGAGWVLADTGRRNWRVFVRSLWVPGLMLAFVLAWSMHNADRHGIFTFTTNGVRASWAYLAATAVADHTPGATFDSVRNAWSDQVHSSHDGQPLSQATVHARMKSQVMSVLSEHPGWMLDSFTGIVRQNLRASNHFAEAQVPRWSRFWAALRNLSHDWINPLIVWLSALGWILLIRAHLWRAALVLGITYAYFSLTAGFSFWQGSRLHFPAEMAWAILVSYVLVRAGERWRGSRYVRDEVVSA